MYLSDTMRLGRGAILEARMVVQDEFRVPTPRRRVKSGFFDCFKPAKRDSWDDSDDSRVLNVLDCSNSIQKRDSKRSKTYRYRSLEGPAYMRLLDILPGSSKAQLQGVLHHVRLDSAEPYIAISYSWGTQKPNRLLRTPEGVIPLTPTLYSALVKLRKKDQHVMVWVDAMH